MRPPRERRPGGRHLRGPAPGPWERSQGAGDPLRVRVEAVQGHITQGSHMTWLDRLILTGSPVKGWDSFPVLVVCAVVLLGFLWVLDTAIRLAVLENSK